MLSSGVRCLLVVLVIHAIIETGSCLDCFSCTSYTHEGCGPVFHPLPENTKTCPTQQPYCIKIVSSDNSDLQNRLCGTPATCRGFSYCSVCEDDMCNSSLNVAPSFTFTIMFGLFMGLYLINY